MSEREPLTGQMRHRITFLSLTVLTDPLGQQTEAFTPAFTRWGKVEMMDTPEGQAYNATAAKDRIKVTVRRLSKPTDITRYRMTVWGDTYNITSAYWLRDDKAFFVVTGERTENR